VSDPVALDSSFRDPSGYVYEQDGVLYRSVAASYKKEYDLLASSGLAARLQDERLLIPYEEVKLPTGSAAYKLLKPRRVDQISYPYEWCFSQLKDAALATLRIQQIALEYGMTLKDASAYNLQFLQGAPILIDTLSFEAYQEGEPWVAYRQFCQHFLAPLALMAYLDVRLGTLSARYLDGVPLDLAAHLLPAKAWLSPGIAAHVRLHAGSQTKHASDAKHAGGRLSRQALNGILGSLESTLRSLRLPGQKTEWGAYHLETHYSAAARAGKETALEEWIARLNPATVWDAGANDGAFSAIASKQGIPTLATDIDPVSVERGYLHMKESGDASLLPLVLDLTNPSPGIGWANHERPAFAERVRCDMAFALALIHHLAIGNNLPLGKVAGFFARHSRYLAIEFVPKEDPKVQILLATREDIFPHYTEQGFEQAFGEHFTVLEKRQLPESLRTLYLLERRG
jgi:hypothetical protein